MDPVHDRGSMDPVHESGPWTPGPCFVLTLGIGLEALSQRFGHPRVLGIPIPISLAFWASPVGDAENADRFDFA